MTPLQKKALDQAIALIHEGLCGLSEIGRKTRDLNSKIGTIRISNDSEQLQKIHVECGRINDDDRSASLREALEWLECLGK